MATVIKINEVHVHIQTPQRHQLSGSGPKSLQPEVINTITSPLLEWSEPLLDGKRVSLKEAEAAVAKLGDGWRMPNLRELQSIVDYDRYDPAIDLTKFPNTKAEPFWTSSECAWNKNARWVVSFGYGGVYSFGDASACVRACRASQSL